MQRKIELDFIRGLAILSVMAFHFNYPITGNILDAFANIVKTAGWVGVDLFFVLSGFLVGGLLMKEYKETGTIKPRIFLIRRALKIWPALYVLIIFHLIVGRHPATTFLWQNIFHVQNYFGTSIKQTWSLAVEEHFYIIVVFAIWTCAKSGHRFMSWCLAFIGVSSIVLRYFAAIKYGVDKVVFE